MKKMTVAGVLAMTMLAACGQVETEVETSGEELASRSGMALTVDILGDTDVAGIAYTITGVDCGTGEPVEPAIQETRVQDLEDLVLPGQNSDLEERPFDAGSQHLFADAFFWLPQGCYDVVAQPVQENGEASTQCAVASQDQVAVFDGQTTEITLINQCINDEAGGLDVIAALNHAPQLEDISYSPSKFTCEDETTICVVASDADSDPLQVTWQLPEGVELGEQSQEEVEAGTQFCAQIIVPGPGDYQVGVLVQDMAYNMDGQQIPIEDLLNEGVQSRDEALLPIHAMSEEACVGQCECPEGFTLNEAGDLCERITVTEAVYNGEGARTICENDESGSYGARGARFPDGGTLVDAFFGGYPVFENNGRLTAAGVWSCENTPNDEWIGFSRCLDIPEAGAYVIGIGGDNEIRVTLNGQEIFYLGFSADNFEYWSMVPVQLPAGASIIELEGLNYGGPAGFAAEIYGPFPIDEVQDDASLMALDYENNIVWSTIDQLGGTFDLGESVGYSCEDGFALDLCGDVATCTSIERQTCE